MQECVATMHARQWLGTLRIDGCAEPGNRGFRPQISYRPWLSSFLLGKGAGSLLYYFEGHNKGGNGVANLRLKYRPRIGLVKKIFKDLRIKIKSCHKLL